MATLTLDLNGLTPGDTLRGKVQDYDLQALRGYQWEWDRIVKSTHLTNCWY